MRLALAVAVAEVAEVTEVVVSLTAGAAAFALAFRRRWLTSVRNCWLGRAVGAQQLGSRRLLRLRCLLRRAFRLGRTAGSRQLGSCRFLRLRHLFWAGSRLPRHRRFLDSCWPTDTKRIRTGLA